MEVYRAGASFLGMQVDFPKLAQRVGLDEVTFVMNVEAVVDGLTLHVGHKTCNVNYCHAFWTLPSLGVDTPYDIPDGSIDLDATAVLDLFASICDRAIGVVLANKDWGESGLRAGQYNIDLDMDEVCIRPLLEAGYTVLSEESGVHAAGGKERGDRVVVVDPLDGSTNASLGLPWFATSLCLVVDTIPRVAMVTNLATGDRYSGISGGGAFHGQKRLQIDSRVEIGDAVVAVSGLPAHNYGWRQFRAMGASALDICAVASGAFDGFVDMSVDAHGSWDYLGALLILQEAGGAVVDALGRDLVVLDHDARRTPIAAGNRKLLDQLLDERAHSS
jgi:myo-inositol-1(or 4)-monophosphatase